MICLGLLESRPFSYFTIGRERPSKQHDGRGKVEWGGLMARTGLIARNKCFELKLHQLWAATHACFHSADPCQCFRYSSVDSEIRAFTSSLTKVRRCWGCWHCTISWMEPFLHVHQIGCNTADCEGCWYTAQRHGHVPTAAPGNIPVMWIAWPQ